ncbi:MAG: ribbon-helix-helix domain-containing protein [Enterococcus hirae]|nr:ribbon-helix-helix domain-containing protein [Methanobrevibacter smithii]MCI6883376.1 ribbon-helix-helix domain-containing protein [Lactobacillus johnsonii]MDD7245181.1 ribbon-helix-helix domain-containing protein [Methanobrevibacter smithii]MDY5311123.1 ribbon-helix-helix domain-containing protein [Enterococcus hirae]
MPRLDIRLTDEQKLHLTNLSAKTGVSFSEIIRKVIDNLDEVNLSLALKKIDKNRAVDIEKIAVKKYQNYLLQNLTNNVNQIAKIVNNNKSKVDVRKLEKQLDLIIKNQKEISKKLK